MAVTLTVPNEFKLELGKGSIAFQTGTFKLILMATGFVFDQDTDGQYQDISADEITSAGGYTVGGQVITADDAWQQDNTNNKAFITWLDETFSASGADFDQFCAGVIIYTSDATTDATDFVVGCIDLGTNIDVTDGNDFDFQNLGYDENDS